MKTTEQTREYKINTDDTKIRVIAGWPRLLSVEQTAKYLSISPKTIRNGLSKSAVKPFPVRPKKFGKRVLFDIYDLDRFVDQMKPGAHQKK